ncbi:NUDIX domain-containing protein, partial [Salmonella enterica subsp. enterica serovar Kentucky]|nr:NUDIX domain-containing protein [Salmonella enterica subsp. enterica serovar Kentucky]
MFTCYLLCKMADNRGVFPGQWALSGGGVEPGERIEEALRREVREE